MRLQKTTSPQLSYSFVLLMLLFPMMGWGQTWTYDFGTGTGSYSTASGSSTTFFTSTPMGGGTYRIRAATTGNQGTGFVLANPGTSLGSGSEVQINASATASTNKFGVYDWTSPSTVAYVKCKYRTTSSGNGVINFSLGINTLVTDNNGYTNQYNNSLTSFTITYASGAISNVQRRISGNNTNISGSGFAKDTDHEIEIYANNASTSTSYTKGGSNSLAAQTWDLWVDGTKVVAGAATAGTLAANTNLSGFGFFAESSTSNAAFVYIDDLEYSNSLPSAPPSIAISTAHPASTNITQASTNNLLASYQLDVTTSAATLNSISVTTAGTYTAADIATNGFKFWINSTNSLTGATQLGSAQAAVGTGGTVAVSGLSQSVPIGTRYILVTADMAVNATAGNTIRIGSTAFSNITFASGTKSGTDPAAASNDMTIIACTPSNITGLSLTPSNAQIAVSWSNPSCLDEIMIVAKATSSITASPSGDGSAYTANLAFGSGTAFDGGRVVYKGTASPQTITGLTNGSTYFVRVFTRSGTTWSSGVESSAVPVLTNATAILWSSSGGSAWLTGTNWTGSNVPTATEVAQFGTNPTGISGVGINFNSTTNAGVQVNGSRIQEMGAVEVTSDRTNAHLIGNSSGTAGATGQFRLNGVVVNSVENVVIRSNSSGNLTIQNTQGTGNQTMVVLLNNSTNNIIVVDGTGDIIISSVISSASGPITITGSGSGVVEFSGQNTYTTETVVAGSTLRLNRTGGNTLPATNNIKVEGGTLRISTNQTINNLTLTGGTITIDPGVTFTINGTVTRTGGSIDASAAGATIVFGNTSPITLPAGLFSGAIQNLTISGTGGVTAGSDLTVNGVLNLASGFLSIGARTLTLNGTTSGSGGIRGGNTSNLVIGGSGSINLRMDQTTPGTTNRLANFTYNKNTTLLDTLEVTGVITPTAGQLNTGDVLKLISTSSGTARIATGSGSYITGKVTAERFVPATAGRRWRFMASPVTNATIEDWRGEIFITGGSGSTTLGTTNTGGFDASPNNSPSIFSYDETNTDPSVNVGWVAPTATTEALTPGKGFRVFVRGDRSNTAMLTNSPPAVNAVTVNVVGSVNSGNIVIPITCTPSGPASTYNNNSDGWNLLGNPYPSDYDWNAFYDANSAALELFIEPTVWVYNASTGTYSSYNAALNGGSLTGGIIPSGSAFWVKSNVLGNHTITLTEAFKTNAQAVNVFKHTEDAGFVVRMVRDSINSSELHIKYKTGATTNFDVMDIRHLPGTVNIAAYGSDSIRLAASARPLTTMNDTIRLDVSGSNGSYTFTFINPSYIDVLDEVYLIDNYLNQVVNLNQTNQYAFSIASSTPATFGANRFMIVVANANPVPVSLAVFNAKVVGQKQVALDWVTVSEVNSSKFEVEHSTNGKQFNTIGNVKAQGNSAKIHNYRFIHKDAAAVNYYRLKMIDMDGSFTTSAVRTVRFDGINESEISLWPIPASQQISVNGVSNEEPVGYIVTDAMGQTVLTGLWSAHTTHELWIENLPQGMYFIKLNSETSNNTFRFIKQ